MRGLGPTRRIVQEHIKVPPPPDFFSQTMRYSFKEHFIFNFGEVGLWPNLEFVYLFVCLFYFILPFFSFGSIDPKNFAISLSLSFSFRTHPNNNNNLRERYSLKGLISLRLGTTASGSPFDAKKTLCEQDVKDQSDIYVCLQDASTPFPSGS